MTSRWLPRHLSGPIAAGRSTLPRIGAADGVAVRQGCYYWDPCPIADRDGNVPRFDAGELWLALSAPVTEDPMQRHELAGLRLLTRNGDRWRDHGRLLPRGFCPGSREWAGSAYLDEGGRVTLFYTATGTAGEASPTFRQRICEAEGTLSWSGAEPAVSDWVDRGEPVRADGRTYRVADDRSGEPGGITGFRDPCYFRHPTSAEEFLLFTASNPAAGTAKDGAIGVAVFDRQSGGWSPRAPLIDADGVSNELERPHVVHHGGLCYLFWSCHGWNFADGIAAPTGLYGMVGRTLDDALQPINGSGLVAANPEDDPYQAYSWWVSKDLRVASFVDLPGGEIGASADSPRYPVGRFAGTIAPEFRLRLDGARAQVLANRREPKA